MSSISFATALRDTRAQAVIDAINAGAGPGTALFYSAPRPAAGAAITTQVLAGTLTFSEPAGTVNNGVTTFATITEDSSVDNTCWIRWVRVLDGDGNFVMDMDAAEFTGDPQTDGTLRAADGAVEGINTAAPVRMPSAHVFQGGALRITGAAFTEGNA
jgi:hypothetical protein